MFNVGYQDGYQFNLYNLRYKNCAFFVEILQLISYAAILKFNAEIGSSDPDHD